MKIMKIMKNIKKMLGMILMGMMFLGMAYGEDKKEGCLSGEETQQYIEFVNSNSLLKITSQLGILSGIGQQFAREGKSVFDEFKEKMDSCSQLFNFLCAQVYGVHLKDMHAVEMGLKSREEINLSNYFNQIGDPSQSKIGEIRHVGISMGVSLVAKREESEVIRQARELMDILFRGLCEEYERSYRQLFDIAEDVAGFQNPYYSLYCAGGKDVGKEDL